MYYCSECGIVVFLNRPENEEKPKTPSLETNCIVCKSKTRYRKIVPEDLDAPNRFEVEDRLSELENN